MKLKWSNEKPETSGVYNVLYRTDEGEFVTACYFDGKDTWYHDVGINYDRIVTDKVIMWQPLPEMPKDNNHRQHTNLLKEVRYYRNLLNNLLNEDEQND